MQFVSGCLTDECLGDASCGFTFLLDISTVGGDLFAASLSLEPLRRTRASFACHEPTSVGGSSFLYLSICSEFPILVSSRSSGD